MRDHWEELDKRFLLFKIIWNWFDPPTRAQSLALCGRLQSEICSKQNLVPLWGQAEDLCRPGAPSLVAFEFNLSSSVWLLFFSVVWVPQCVLWTEANSCVYVCVFVSLQASFDPGDVLTSQRTSSLLTLSLLSLWDWVFFPLLPSGLGAFGLVWLWLTCSVGVWFGLGVFDLVCFNLVFSRYLFNLGLIVLAWVH